MLIIFSGYVAPEYLHRGEFSTQSDIYSLGVLILETTTGQENGKKNPSGREYIYEVRVNITLLYTDTNLETSTTC